MCAIFLGHGGSDIHTWGCSVTLAFDPFVYCAGQTFRRLETIVGRDSISECKLSDLLSEVCVELIGSYHFLLEARAETFLCWS